MESGNVDRRILSLVSCERDRSEDVHSIVSVVVVLVVLDSKMPAYSFELNRREKKESSSKVRVVFFSTGLITTAAGIIFSKPHLQMTFSCCSRLGP